MGGECRWMPAPEQWFCEDILITNLLFTVPQDAAAAGVPDGAAKPGTFIKMVLSSGDESQTLHSSASEAAKHASYSFGFATTAVFKAGPDVVDRVLNTSVVAWLVRADSKTAVGRAVVDTASLLCGTPEVLLQALPVEPVGQEVSHPWRSLACMWLRLPAVGAQRSAGGAKRAAPTVFGCPLNAPAAPARQHLLG